MFYSPTCYDLKTWFELSRVKLYRNDLGPVVQKVDSVIHLINLYRMKHAIGFPNTYPLDSNLAVG